MSDQAKTKPSPGNPFAREIIRLAGVLFVICAVAAGLLGFVNSITVDRIAAINIEKVNNALLAVMPEADRFEALEAEGQWPAPIEGVWEAYSGDQMTGLCLQVAPQGFGGAIVTIVGVSDQGVLTGVQITSQSETAGLGTKTADPQWLAQFAGLSGPLSVAKNVATGEQDIVAVTAATISSTAVTNGVQAALDYANRYLGGGQ